MNHSISLSRPGRAVRVLVRETIASNCRPPRQHVRRGPTPQLQPHTTNHIGDAEIGRRLVTRNPCDRSG
jgi:hypothetical protein